MNEGQRTLLETLLTRDERSQSDSRPWLRVTPERFANYFDDTQPERILKWEHDVHALARQGWIGLEVGRGARAHRIERVRLLEAKHTLVEAALGRLSLENYRERAREILETEMRALLDLSPLWQGFLEEEQDRIDSQVPHSDRRVGLIDDLKTLLLALQALGIRRATSPNDRRVMSWRQFSVALFADSKRLDQMKEKIAQTLARFALDASEDELDSDSVLSYFGIESKEEIFLIHGPVAWGDLRAVNWLPFLPLPETMANDPARVITVPGALGVLTIENEETFHSWCRMNPATEWIGVYLGGFPSQGKIELLRRLTSVGLPLRHWGDLDCGGIEIFLYLERSLKISIEPYGMESRLLGVHRAQAQALTGTEFRRLKKIEAKLDSQHRLRPLILEMHLQKLKLEQEAVANPNSGQ